jgi:hypothetical protein
MTKLRKKSTASDETVEPTAYELPYDVNVKYREAVKELGLEKGYDTKQCPHCGKLLWVTGEVVEAKL